jgi:hypothetical protein
VYKRRGPGVTRPYWILPVQRATLDVTVDPGGVVPLRYKVRWLIFLPGKLHRVGK